jgi:hypothetical protein
VRAQNLLYFSLEPHVSHGFSAAELVSTCASEGVRFLVVPGASVNRMRMVTHHQVAAEDVERALEVITRACEQPDWVVATAAAPAAAATATAYAGGK